MAGGKPSCVSGGTPAQEPEQPDDLTPTKVRAIIFFDGTLNNKTNTAAAAAVAEHAIAHPGKHLRKFIADGESSYNNDYTNVAFLYENAAMKQPGDFDATYKIYTEGAGTTDYDPEKDKGKDDMPGFAFGAGRTGIHAKTEKGLDNLLNQITRKFTSETKIDFTDIRIDLFGFSRGSTAARHFIHVALHGDSYEATGGIRIVHPLKAQLQSLGYTVSCEPKVHFVGIYDTVSSLGLEGTLFQQSDVEKLALDAVAEAEYVYHLVSVDEHRKNFALTNIRSAGSKGKEIYLPGVHCDIGGSYVEGMNQEIEICHEGWFSTDLNYRQIQADLAALINDGWFDATDLYHGYEHRFLRPGEPVREAINELGQVYVQRKKISSRYSRIPLHIMRAKAAESYQTEFNERILHDTQTTLEAPVADAFILEVKAKLEAYAAGANSRIEDWQLCSPLLYNLRKKHLHFSANYKKIFGAYAPRFEDDYRTRKVHDG